MNAGNQGMRVLRGAVRIMAAGATLSVLTVAAHAETLHGRDVSVIMARTPLSARALSNLRGRYVASGGVVYFGLEIVSRWTQADGAGLSVGTNVNLGIDGEGHPHLSVNSFSHETGSNGGASSSGHGTITGNPIAGVSGIGQGIQTTGDGNVIQNAAVINVTSGAAGGSGPSGPSGTRNLSVVGGGGQGSVEFNANSVIVAVNVPGQGVIQQTLGAQGIGQSAQVLSSANNILNQMSLNVGFAKSGGFSAAQISTILGAMRGL